jgi:lipopolysaccharide/colanic/teichoic acid biosynthesis glycosyltransferase
MNSDTLKWPSNYLNSASFEGKNLTYKEIQIIKLSRENEKQLTHYYSDGIDFSFMHAEELAVQLNSCENVPSAIFIDSTFTNADLKKLRPLINKHCIPLILMTGKFDDDAREKAIELQTDDYFYGSINETLLHLIETIKKLKEYNALDKEYNQIPSSQVQPFKMWALKRAFDVFASSLALLALSPFFLFIALIIKLESKGPVFYISKRAGAGFKVFNFYKFRSMRTGADQELKTLADKNQYGSDEGIFFKIKDDPRITRFGCFLRNTSLDELPQLVNVLKGDMSLVGNRPLPLYEAEKLTQDQIAWRFLAPAGLTGLWQISKRGKHDMSPQERIQLDMEYAMNNSFFKDIEIILKTFPALLQKEKV